VAEKKKNKKERLDKLLVDRGLCESREKARAMILAGKVVVGEHRVDKAGTRVLVDAPLRLKSPPIRYVSRGGLKLEAALEHFGFEPEGHIALDLGASTGGFTDCLLQNGCKKVVAVDVGYGQLHPKLRNDPRVLCMERTNARYLTADQIDLEEGEELSLVVGDLSFISLRLVLGAVIPLLAEGAELILLVKPQFEAGRENVGKGGVVRDDDVRKACVDNVIKVAAELGLFEKGRMDCPVHGPKGNIEILLWLQKDTASNLNAAQE